jgi:hypothetical protein
MMVELDGLEWIELLSQDRPPSKKRLVYQMRFRKTLRVRKSEWSLHFDGWGGLTIRPRDEIEILLQAEGEPSLELPDWVIQQLALSRVDNACITQRGDRFYLKALQQFGYLGPLLPDGVGSAAGRIGVP